MTSRPEYQERPAWITGRAWARGYLDAFELTRIAAWKSARAVAAITVNEPAEIEANGYLLSRAGLAKGVDPWPALWTGPAAGPGGQGFRRLRTLVSSTRTLTSGAGHWLRRMPGLPRTVPSIDLRPRSTDLDKPQHPGEPARAGTTPAACHRGGESQ
jgi:hypothetical protein